MRRMPLGAFWGYLNDLPSLEAARLLDQAAVAHPSTDWIRALQAQAARRDNDQADAPSSGPPSLFTFNHRPVGLVELMDELAGELGSGFGVN